MKKTVAIIGAQGNLGSAIALRLARAGYRTLVTGHDHDDLLSLIGKLPYIVGKIRLMVPHADLQISLSEKEASWEADIIIPTVPYKAQAAVASEIKDVVTGKIIVSANNPLSDTLDSSLTFPTTSAAEELAKLLPHSKVVQAFSTILAADVEAPQITGELPEDIFVAGDDAEAVSTVSQLVKDAGFNPLIVGTLSMSRTLESMMLLLANLSVRNNDKPLVGWKVLCRAAQSGS